MAEEKDLEALNLRRAGVPIPKIMEACGFRTRKTCLAAIDRALVSQGAPADPIGMRALELDRLDRLHFAVWMKAVNGDGPSVDRVLEITAMRLRIAGIIEAGLTPLTEAYDATMDLLNLEPIDQAAVAIGRRYCEQIDAASGLGDPIAVTKALHLMPHIVNLLDRLGATPAARAAFRGAAPKAPAATPEGGAKVTGLAAFKEAHGVGS